MKRKLILTLLLSFTCLIGLNVIAQDNGFFEKEYQKNLANDKLGNALKAEANKQVLQIGVLSKCSGLKEEVQNAIEVQLKSSEILVINLKGAFTSGYVWEITEMNNDFVSLVAEGMEPTKEIGGLNIKRFVLMGNAAGETTIKIVHRRPWEGKAPSKEYTIKITSEGKYSGNFKFVAEPAPLKEEPVVEKEVSTKALPASFDWRTQGKVTPIKDQGQTGACWSFGACASFESVIAIKTGAIVNLSEQWLCDCNSYGMDCQNGGWFPQYMFKSYGAVYESQDPFYGYNQYCYSYTYHERATSWGYTSGISDYPVPYYSHSATNTQIKQCVYTYGPIAAMTYCGDWGSYYGGIWYGHSTTGGHIVSIVGWDDAGGYWIIKNSWGSSWGENGFMRLAYDRSYMGRTSVWITMTGTTPTVCDLSINLVANSITNTSAYLDWAPPASGGHTGWNLQYRKAGTTTWTTKASSVSYYTVTGLTAGTTYEWRVQTVCSSLSEWTAINTFTTTGGVIDTQAPTAPTNLQAPSTTASSVNLTWTASTDNVAVTGYDVYNGSTLAGTSTSTSYTVTGLSSNTSYTFTVKAKDAAGNVSAASNAVTATTLLPTTYCTASSYGASGQYISKVVVGTFTNSTSYATGGYADYTNLNISIKKGVASTLKVTCAPSTWSGTYCYAWIDWNGNGSFADAGEQVMTKSGVASSNTYSVSVTAPSTAVASTRMRVRTSYTAVPTACDYVANYGETEDYTVKIAAASGNPLNTDEFSLRITPNPTSDRFTIHISGVDKAKVQVISITGQVVIEEVYTKSSGNIDMNKLAKGLYLVKASAFGRTLSKKLVVQ